MDFREFDLDNLEIEIRKATPVRYRRAKIWIKPPKAKMIITSEERHPYERDGISCVVGWVNHEFMHWIICLLTKTKPKQYDKFLQAIGLYWAEYLEEENL